MEIEQIEEYLASADSQQRLTGIRELRNYDTEIAVPLLKSKISDKEFIVRSFVAMGLGKKKNAESFAALLELIKFDRDPNVRAEAANSLSFFGEVAASHLLVTFNQDDHWLVRRSILAAIVELNCPQETLEICLNGLQGEDLSVQLSSIECLSLLAGTAQQELALNALLAQTTSESWRNRQTTARALSRFNDTRAREALLKLRQDENHHVVAAVLEKLI